MVYKTLTDKGGNMDKIRINIKNADKLNAAIKAAEGRATARTETAESIARMLADIAGRYGIPKKRLDGTRVYFDGGQKFPTAYKYTPESTHWEAEYKNGNWFVTAVWRDRCPNRTTQGTIAYSDTAKAWILENASII